MSRRFAHHGTLTAAVLTVIVITGCAGSPNASGPTVTETVTVTATASPSPPDPVEQPTASESATDPVESATPEPAEEFASLAFGDTLPTRSPNGTSSDITLGKPKLAACQYFSIGCDEPEIGDRVVQIPILIENTGSSAVEWGRSYFVLEFADGTQVEMGDGASFDYMPDNALDYDAKVRVGGKLNSVLVFEAPKGPFSVLVLTSPYDGEPFAAWS